MAMHFCSNCGKPLTQEIPPRDNRIRSVCHACGTIHYVNPKMVVCTIPIIETKRGTEILLCKRAIAPRDNYWTLPGGFMEINETTEQAAIRETFEEATAIVSIKGLFAVMNLSIFQQVHLFYLANLKEAQFSPGEESREVRLFTENEIPWNQLAFSTITHALKFFFDDQKQISFKEGNFGVHSIDLSY